jgi:hypothetical protein
MTAETMRPRTEWCAIAPARSTATYGLSSRAAVRPRTRDRCRDLSTKVHAKLARSLCAEDVWLLDRLRLRGPRGARDEFHLAFAAQNLRKLAKLLPMMMPPLPA